MTSRPSRTCSTTTRPRSARSWSCAASPVSRWGKAPSPPTGIDRSGGPGGRRSEPMAFLMAGDQPRPVEAGDGKPRFDRVVVKLSGEAFADTSVGFGLDYGKIDGVARQLVEVLDLGVQVAVVVGGGNIIRGSAAEAAGMGRARGD